MAIVSYLLKMLGQEPQQECKSPLVTEPLHQPLVDEQSLRGSF